MYSRSYFFVDGNPCRQEDIGSNLEINYAKLNVIYKIEFERLPVAH